MTAWLKLWLVALATLIVGVAISRGFTPSFLASVEQRNITAPVVDTNYFTLSTDRLPGGVSWNVNSVGVEGGIPTYSTVSTNISQPSSGAEIEAAINAAAVGSAVVLRSGFFAIDQAVDHKSGVELRGTATGVSGFSESAVTVGTGSKSFLCYSNANLYVGDIVRAYASPSTNNYLEGDITTYSGTNLVINVTTAVGSGTLSNWYIFNTNWTVLLGTAGGGFVSGILRMAGPFVDPPSVTPLWTGGTNQGATNITVDSATGLAVGELVGLDRIDDTALGVTNDGSLGIRDSGTRGQGQIVQIKAISGTDITISHPVLMTNYAGGTPELWRIGAPITNAGYGNFVIWNVDQDNADANMHLQGTWNCWVTNVHSIGAEKAHIRTYQNARTEVRRCFFRHTEAYASQSYGISASYNAFSLFEDNVFHVLTSPILLWGSGTAGNVIAYNFADISRYYNSPAFMSMSYFTHGAHPHMNLFEGNRGNALVFDYEHGSSSHNAAFRNVFTGHEIADALYNVILKTTHTYPAQAYTRNRYISWVGNVLGYSGYHTGYRIDGATTDAHDNKAIFRFGYRYSYISDLSLFDTAVTNTVTIAGNYNYTSNSIPAVESLGSTNLASSWFRSSKPAWFGNRPWPWVNAADPSTISITNFPAGYRFVFGTNSP